MLELRENGENKMENKFREENQLLVWFGPEILRIKERVFVTV